jgi:hypothetical protein
VEPLKDMSSCWRSIRISRKENLNCLLEANPIIRGKEETMRYFKTF